MLNDLETSSLRNLENRCALVIDVQNTVLAKLKDAVKDLELRYEDPEMTQALFATCVMKWHELLVVKHEQAAHAVREFVHAAEADLSPEELDEHEPGGYIKERLRLLEAARDLVARSHAHLQAITFVMADWRKAAGMDPTTPNNGQPNE